MLRLNRLLLILIFFSCSLTKKIKTNSNDITGPTIVFQSEKVRIITSKDLMLRLAYKLLVNDIHYSNGLEVINGLENDTENEHILPLKIEEGMKLEETEIMRRIVLFPALRQVLKSGQMELYNKITNQFEKQYYWKKVRDNLGSETEVFTLEDGEKFLIIPVALGE